MREYALRPKAYTDVDEIGEYIAEHSTVEAAKRVVDEIFKPIFALIHLPLYETNKSDFERAMFAACRFSI